MRNVVTISKILLGLIFLAFGLNGFFHYMGLSQPSGVPGSFMGAIFTSHYFGLIFGVQVAAGFLLLVSQFVPFALALLAPVLANILTYHSTMDPDGAPWAVFVTILWLFLAWKYRAYFRSLFVRQAAIDRGAGPE